MIPREVKIKYWDKEGKKELEDFKKKVKKEKYMLEHDIRVILAEYYKKKRFHITKERSPSTNEGHPYDLVVGKIGKNKYSKEQEMKILGFEIKSDRDNFSRLKTQLNSYNKYCDEVYVVVHKKEVPKEFLMDAGLIRVSNTGEFVIEKTCYIRSISYNDVSGKSEINILLKQQGLGSRHSSIKEIFDMTPKIWRKILFNRFFGVMSYESGKFTKYFPFTKKEVAFIMKSQFDWQLKHIAKKSRELSRMTDVLNMISKDCLEFSKPGGLKKFVNK